MTSRKKRAERGRVWTTCPNCGEKGRHFAPPGFGSPGMYICQPKEPAQIDAPVPAERAQGESGGSGTSRTLPDPKGGCVCWFESEDRGGGYSELVQEYEPACPVHSEHLYDPRTGFWVIRAEQDQDQADRAHKAVHDTLRWVEGKERDARRASDKANEQVYQQVARMLRRAFDRAGTAEIKENR